MGGSERLPSEIIGARTCLRVEEFGKKVTRVVDDSDIFGPILSVWQDPVEPNLLFVGGEYGFTSVWTEAIRYTNGPMNVPTVQVMDLAFQAREKDLVLGTFGRGAWVIDDIEPLRVLAAGEGLQSLARSSSRQRPTSGSVSQSPGVRFAGMSTFRGENRPFGARMTAYLPEVAEDNKKKFRVDYQDEAGDTIYTQYIKVKEVGFTELALGDVGERYGISEFQGPQRREGAERSPRGSCTSREPTQ